ncbi:MAG: (d)CMP kinase [Alphaproteobacteria bacterium]|jgi:cytidylate kinase|nr:(d)CMP kinase [Alphaproteobacteria bacterium]
MIIAVDGPAASGKGTLARRLADRFGLPHLDTGLLYRATGLAVLKAGGDPADEADAVRAAETLSTETLADPALREDRAANAASQVAAIPGVRAALLAFQRDFAARPGGAVLDGRDIGTVVCPDAAAKLFVTASPEVRARRRLEELRSGGGGGIYPEILRDMRDRDERDSRRAVSPLRPAIDAFVIDTDDLSPDEVLARAVDFIEARIAGA